MKPRQLLEAAAWGAIENGDLDGFLAANGLAEVRALTSGSRPLAAPKDAPRTRPVSPLRSLPKCLQCSGIFDPSAEGRVSPFNERYGFCSVSHEREYVADQRAEDP